MSLDLGQIAARHRLAQMAGTDADDAGNGWDKAKINALVRSWQDVYDLMLEVQRLYAENPQPRRAKA